MQRRTQGQGQRLTHRIGIIGGDGIGPEVVAEALKVVDAAGVELRDRRLRPRRRPLPARRRRAPRRGPRGVAGPRRRASSARSARPTCRPGVIERGLLLQAALRARPLREPAARSCRPAANDGVDFLVVRENTEGTYAGEGGFLRKGTPHEIATQGSVNTRMGVERCVRYAFDLARSRDRQPPHAGAQDQRAHLRRRPLGADLRRGRRRVPRRRRPPTTTSTPPASTSCRIPAATT